MSFSSLITYFSTNQSILYHPFQKHNFYICCLDIKNHKLYFSIMKFYKQTVFFFLSTMKLFQTDRHMAFLLFFKFLLVGKGQRSNSWGEIWSLMGDMFRYTAFKSLQVKRSWEKNKGSALQTLPVEY